MILQRRIQIDIRDHALYIAELSLNGIVNGFLYVNGRMAGVWKHEQKGRTVTIEIEPFGNLPRWTRTHIAAEAERSAAFLGGGLQLTVRR